MKRTTATMETLLFFVLLSFLASASATELFTPPATCVCDPLCEAVLDDVEQGASSSSSSSSSSAAECRLVERPDCPCCKVCAADSAGAACDPDKLPCDANKGLECDAATTICKETTKPLCHFEGLMRRTAERYVSSDCKLTCRCSANGTTVCEPLQCRRGLLRRGELSEPNCEERESNDDCCVLVVCSATEGEEEEEDGEINDEGTQVVDSFDIEREVAVSLVKTTTQASTVTTTTTTTTTTPTKTSTAPEEESGNLEFLQITDTTVQVQFPGITGGNLMYVEEKLFRKKMEQHVGGDQQHVVPWENSIILEGNKIFTLTGLRASTEYRLRWLAPDRQFPDVMVTTRAPEEKLPKAIVTEKSFDHVTFKFDHFAPENYAHSYVAMYKIVDGGRWQSREQSEAERAQNSDLPSVRVGGLKPDTEYEARIAVYDNYSIRSLGKSTGVIEFKTDRGCLHLNASHPVGHFFVGCDSSCECSADGAVECGPRCALPFHRAGSWGDDPLCVEQFVDDDKCCVIVTCAGNAELDDEESPCHGIECGPNAECRHEVRTMDQDGGGGGGGDQGASTAAETICVCRDGHTGDPDDLSRGCVTNRGLDRSMKDETSDGESPRSSSSSSSGGIGSSGLLAVDEIEKNPPTEPQPPPTTTSGAGKCRAKNETYGVGEEWNDGCELKCVCNDKVEIVCQERCKVFPKASHADCELRPDPEDSCCQVMFCPDPDAPASPSGGGGGGEGGGPASVLKAVEPLQFDGCVFKGESYAKGERFYDGCEQQCQCMGYGDMVCLSRCPPTASAAPGQNCYTLPDASDPCCNITVCDEPSLDPEQDVDKETEEEEVKEVDRSNLARIVTEPFGKPISGTPYKGLFIGDFSERQHDVGGSVYAINETLLLVKAFTYDGLGPDAFFWAGTDSDRPTTQGKILPYPFDGRHFDYDSKDAPVLGRFDGSEDLMLRLPPPLTVDQIRWISVWCRAFAVNFGELILPQRQELLNVASSSGPGAASASPHACAHKGEMHELGSQFYEDGACERFCHCDAATAEVTCFPVKCPSSFGLDVINPFCLDWDDHSADFAPSPQTGCCPPVPVCLSDGTCHYQGHKFTNFDTIPMNLTGCEQRCYCENGEVLCQPACYSIPESPPGYLACRPEVALLVPQEDRPCCMAWGCPDPDEVEEEGESEKLPDKLNEVTQDETAANATALALDVALPRSIDGMRGYYQVFLTSGLQGHPDPNQWPTRAVLPEDGKISVNREGKARLVLDQLLPNQQYFLKVELHLMSEGSRDESVITSDVFSARTSAVEPSTTEHQVMINSVDLQLRAADVTSVSAYVTWRFFDAQEKPYIDGVQLRFLQLTGDGSPASGVPGTTPFIHRDTNFFLLQDLKPETEYRVDLYIIPVHGTAKELVSEKAVTFRTLPPVQDPYDFSIALNLVGATAHTLDLHWSGPPNPHQKYVNIYRVLYVVEDDDDHHHQHQHRHNVGQQRHQHAMSNSVVEIQSVFKVAKIDSHNAVMLSNLRPETRYQVWLQAYLRNGKVIESNVLEVATNNRAVGIGGGEIALPSGSRHDDAAHNEDTMGGGGGDYYNSLVAAAIVACFIFVALVVVTALYLKRTTTYEAIISGSGGPMDNQSNYDGFQSNGGGRSARGRGRANSTSTTASSVNEISVHGGDSNAFELNGIHSGNGKKN